MLLLLLLSLRHDDEVSYRTRNVNWESFLAAAEEALIMPRDYAF
jgi:hypothetical protein